jgi:hypothetical protein
MAATNSKTLFPVPAFFLRASDEAFRADFSVPVKRSDAVGRFFFTAEPNAPKRGKRVPLNVRSRDKAKKKRRARFGEPQRALN